VALGAVLVVITAVILALVLIALYIVFATSEPPR
jgi:hypothetical protein